MKKTVISIATLAVVAGSGAMAAPAFAADATPAPAASATAPTVIRTLTAAAVTPTSATINFTDHTDTAKYPGDGYTVYNQANRRTAYVPRVAGVAAYSVSLTDLVPGATNRIIVSRVDSKQSNGTRYGAIVSAGRALNLVTPAGAVPAPIQVVVTAPAVTAAPGETITVPVAVAAASGAVAPSVTSGLIAGYPGKALFPVDVVNGAASFTFAAPTTPGFYTLSISFADATRTYASATAKTTVTVLEPAAPIEGKRLNLPGYYR